MIRCLATFSICLLLCSAEAAQIGVGSTREEVLAAFGEPAGRSSAGSREVLSYPRGRVFLREGRVEDLDGALASAETVAPAPESAPAPPPAPAAEKPAAPKPAPVAEEPAAPRGDWKKRAAVTIFLCVVLLLGRHWMRVAKRAQESRRTDPLSR